MVITVNSSEREKRNCTGARKFDKLSWRGSRDLWLFLNSQLETNSVVQQKHLLYRLFYPQSRMYLQTTDNYSLIMLFRAEFFLSWSITNRRNFRLRKILTYTKVDLVSKSFESAALTANIVTVTVKQWTRKWGNIFVPPFKRYRFYVLCANLFGISD